MANRWKGNFVVATAATSDGTNYTGKANGAWGLNSQLQQKKASLWAKGIAPPVAPVIGSATLTSISTATVTFTGSTDNNGSPITSYIITRYPDNVTTSVISAGSADITGLALDVTYTFSVAAVTAFGTSNQSSLSNSITPTLVIGASYGGGYYAGKISTSADGVATHRLIVAPKATGQITGINFGNYGTDTGFKSRIDGPTNSAGIAALGGTNAATFCEGLSIGGYTDWYLPALNELEVLYYYFKPSGTSNYAGGTNGANPNAVSPEPVNIKYTTTNPSQTSVSPFTSTEAFDYNTVDASKFYLTSTDLSGANSWNISFNNGQQASGAKLNNYYTRAVRRIPI